MRINVIKSLANPIKIFNVPYALAIFNFIIQFIIYMSVFIFFMTISKGNILINPLYFLCSIIIVHIIFIRFSKKEDHLFNIIVAKINFIYLFWVKRLIV